MSTALGIDIGGTGIKGALIDINTGELLSERKKIKTPKPASPELVIETVKQLLAHFEWQGKPFGCGFPSIIKQGICYSAANIDKSWIGMNLDEYFKAQLGAEVTFINDADCAGLAEMTFGNGQNEMGSVLLLTLGTGIGSGLFLDGQLVPNTELGHLKYKESIVEHYGSNSARENNEWSWSVWGAELNEVLKYIDLIINPNLIIIGGGISKKFDNWSKFIDISTRVIPAKLRNNAGIIGAAVNASRRFATVPIVS